MKTNQLKIALAQLSPVWLDKKLTLLKIENAIIEAAKEKSQLIIFGESYLPGYPFWLSFTHGSKFNSEIQKDIHAHYHNNAVCIEDGDLKNICKLANEHKIAIYLGSIEKANDRGKHSLYCSLIYIDQDGIIKSVHRKLRPTYEERLSWSPGDGNGLQAHALKNFTVGGLNCWENWMPLARTALYAQGVNLHVAVWPGSLSNTHNITSFIAIESRSFVVSVSSILTKSQIPKSMPHYDHIMDSAPEAMANGGSCIANPDGSWLIEPVIDKEQIIYGELDLSHVIRERQNFDPSGHYSRPDVTKLIVNRERQSTVHFKDE